MIMSVISNSLHRVINKCGFLKCGLCESYSLQETMNKTLESVTVLKRAVCTVALPWIKYQAPSSVTDAAVTFCNTNSSLFEVSLQTLNTVCLSLPLWRLGVYAWTFSLFSTFWKMYFLLWPVFVTQLFFLWSSDIDWVVHGKPRRDDDNCWNVGVSVWPAAKWSLTMGEPSSFSWDLLFLLCWTTTEQHCSFTDKSAKVTYLYK